MRRVTPAKPATLYPVATGIWCADAVLPGTPIPIRMTVFQLADRRLILHSTVALEDDEVRKIEALGPVAFIVIPNAMHRTYARWATERFPRARVLAARSILKTVRHDVAWTEPIEDNWGEDLRREIEMLAIPGTRVGETVFLHPASRTLVLTDLAFNIVGPLPPVVRFAMTLNGVANRFGMSNFYRLYGVRNRDAVLRAIAEVANWDFDRVIVCHGRIVKLGGRAAFRTAFRIA